MSSADLFKTLNGFLAPDIKKVDDALKTKRLEQIGQATRALGTIASVRGPLNTSERLADRMKAIGDREATIRTAQARQLRGEQDVSLAARGLSPGSASAQRFIDQTTTLEFQDVENQRFIQDAVAADITTRGQARALSVFGVDYTSLFQTERAKERILNPFGLGRTALGSSPGGSGSMN